MNILRKDEILAVCGGADQFCNIRKVYSDGDGEAIPFAMAVFDDFDPHFGSIMMPTLESYNGTKDKDGDTYLIECGITAIAYDLNDNDLSL